MNKIDEQKKLITFLADFVTPERIQRFESVLQNRTRHITVVLEDIYQSHNTSAVLRSCDCFGVQDVHIIENKNTYSLNPDIALGSSKWLNIYQYNKKDNNTADCIKSLKKSGYQIVATSLHTQSIDIKELDITKKTALFYGTEKDGLSDIVLNSADAHMKIPMFGFTESFNISVSVALSLFYLTDKLRQSSIKWQLSEMERFPVMLDWLRNTIKNVVSIEKRFNIL